MFKLDATSESAIQCAPTRPAALASAARPVKPGKAPAPQLGRATKGAEAEWEAF